MPLVLIGLGGFAGAITRYLVDGAVAERTGGGFPWGTLVINVSGSFLLGLLFALTAERAICRPIRGPVMIGFLGAYTTFSTFMLESWRLVETGAGARPWPTSAGRWCSAWSRRRRPDHRASAMRRLMDIDGRPCCSASTSARRPRGGKPRSRRSSDCCATHGIAGATVLRGIEGFGANSPPPHDAHPATSEDLPWSSRSSMPGAVAGDPAGAGRPRRRWLITVELVEVIAYRGTVPGEPGQAMRRACWAPSRGMLGRQRIRS